MTYINVKTSQGVETVDQFESRKEAGIVLKEYQMSDPHNHYYLSERSTKAWRDEW